MKKILGPRLTFARFLTIVFFGIAFFMVINLGQGWLMCRSALFERQAKSQAVEAERTRRDGLVQTWTEALSPASIARTIREELGWGRRDEGSAILQYQNWPPAEERTDTTEGREQDAPPHWLGWLSAFLLP